MKKILLTLSAILIANAAYAAVSNDEIISEQYVKNHGHSTEMARLIHLQNDQINGHCVDGAKMDKGIYDSSKGWRFVRSILEYIDPGLDNGNFMRNDIKFETRYDNL